MQLLESLVERQDETEQKLEQVDTRTKRLSPAHARAVQEYITRMVHRTQRAATPLTYAMIYGRLKHRFRVGSYSEAPDERFNEIMTFLQEELQKTTNNTLLEQRNLF